MEILGVGPSEFIFIVLIAIIVMGPKQMKEAGRVIGHWLNRLNTSDFWKLFRDTSREIGNLPRRWMREANMELWDAEQELQNSIDPRPRRGDPAPGVPQRRPKPSPSPRLTAPEKPDEPLAPETNGDDSSIQDA